MLQLELEIQQLNSQIKVGNSALQHQKDGLLKIKNDYDKSKAAELE